MPCFIDIFKLCAIVAKFYLSSCVDIYSGMLFANVGQLNSDVTIVTPKIERKGTCTKCKIHPFYILKYRCQPFKSRKKQYKTHLPNKQESAVNGKDAPSDPLLFITTILPYNVILHLCKITRGEEFYMLCADCWNYHRNKVVLKILGQTIGLF